MEKMYTLFWLHGETEIVKGNAPHEAMNNAGYGAGAVRALDFYAEGDQRENWVWKNEIGIRKLDRSIAYNVMHKTKQGYGISLCVRPKAIDLNGQVHGHVRPSNTQKS